MVTPGLELSPRTESHTLATAAGAAEGGDGMSAWPITQEPGTCGGCKHFRRYNNRNDKPSASGKCLAKPNTRWITFQSDHACKKHYETEEDV